MKFVITGSSGQLGSYLMEHFAKKHEVIGLDNRVSPYPDIAKHARLVDIARIKDLREYLVEVDWVIHAAAQVSVEKSIKDPLFDAENNVIGTVNLLWNSFRYEVKQFLYIGSAAVYGNPKTVPIDEGYPTDPLSPYGTSKLCGEKYAQAFSEAYGLSTVIVRPFNIYSRRADPESPYSGVITKFISWAKESEPLLIEGDGSQTRDFVHISDVVRMIDLIAHNPSSAGRIFNCGTGKAHSISELAELIISLSPNKVTIKHGPPRPGDIKYSCANIQLAEEMLDYSPKMNLLEGLRELFS